MDLFRAFILYKWEIGTSNTFGYEVSNNNKGWVYNRLTVQVLVVRFGVQK